MINEYPTNLQPIISFGDYIINLVELLSKGEAFELNSSVNPLLSLKLVEL